MATRYPPRTNDDQDYDYYWGWGDFSFRIPPWLVDVPRSELWWVFALGVCLGVILAGAALLIGFLIAQ